MPLIEHWVPQAPLPQTWPPPQLVPSVAFVQAVVLELGVQTSHPLFMLAPEA